MTSRRWFARWATVLVALPAAALFAGTGTATAGGSCHSSATAARGAAVSLSGLCFGPTVLYVEPGTRVTWTNRDDTAHTVTGLGFRWGSDGDLNRRDSVSYRFTTSGVYPYSCIIHPGMVGAVVVGNAGSPKAAAGIPIAVRSGLPPSPAAQTVPQAAAKTSASSSTSSDPGPWRTIAIVTVALLVGAVTTLGLQRRPRGGGIRRVIDRSKAA